MKDNTTSLFADRLQDLISKSGKTISILSKEMGISEGSLSKYQNDSGEAGIIKLAKLAKYFKVSTDYLLGLTEVKTPNTEIQAVSNMLGLSEEAVNSIISINGIHFQPSKDILNEILISGKFSELVADIVLTIEPYFQKKRSGIKRALTNFDYQLWISNRHAIDLIDRVIESYYLKNKESE